MGVTIGLDRERGGLYYLDLQWRATDGIGKAHQSASGYTSKEQIWLWHQRLGHSLFTYLHKLFPSSFFKLDISSFHCEICELAKHHRVSFSLSSNKSGVPFLSSNKSGVPFSIVNSDL